MYKQKLNVQMIFRITPDKEFLMARYTIWSNTSTPHPL